MKSLIALIKVSLNSSFGISAFLYKCRKNKKTIGLAVAFVALMAVSFAPLLYLYFSFLDILYQQASMLGQGHVVLGLATVISQIFVLVFGVYYLMSNFYFSQDLSILVPLPLRPGTVLTAKFITVIVSEWLTTASIAIPAIVIYGIRAQTGILFWLMSLVIFLVLPVIPIVIGAVFVIVLMRFTNLSRNKDLLRVLGIVVMLVIIFGSQYFLTQLPSGNEEEFFYKVLTDPDGLIYVVSKRFPPALWASKAMAYAGTMNGLVNFVYFFGLTALSMAVLYVLGERFFYAGLIGGSETARKKQVSARRVAVGVEREGTPLTALLQREFKLFFRNPIFLMTAFINILVVPIAMILPIMFSGELNTLLDDLRGLFQTDPKAGFIASFAAGAFIICLTVLNSVAATSISREGKLFWISKMIPTDPKLQVLSKLLHSGLFTLLSTAVVVVIIIFLVPIPLTYLLLGVLLGFVGSIFANALGIMTDLLLPNLKWTDPQKAMKGNMNNLWMFLFILLLIAAGGFLLAKLLSTGVEMVLIYVGYFVVLCILSAASVYYLFNSAAHYYASIEE